MVKTLSTLALGAAVLALSAPASAADLSFVGNFQTGNDVQLFNFTVGTASNVTLRTWSYAGGTNAAGTVIARGGFDPILALFDSAGAFINQNDDGGANVAADSATGSRYDTFLQAALAPGNYTVSVMAYSNFANGPNLSDGFRNSGSFGGRATNWAFDILNVDVATQAGAVPEPASWMMMIAGFGAIGSTLRRSKKVRTAVSYA